MRVNQDIRITITGMGTYDCGRIIRAMEAEGWRVDAADDVAQLASLAASGAYHVAVVACTDPYRLPRQPVGMLLGLHLDMSVIFLVSDQDEAARCPALAGVTSDQVHGLDSPEAELIAVFKREVCSALSDQAEFTIMCVDDDEIFLRLLQSFLPGQLRNASPRFALDFEFFKDPLDALEEVRHIPCGRLAVVISDQVMPKMEGVELLQEIRHLSPNTLCVLLTGHAALDSAVRAINEQTLDKYFFKPIEETVDFINNINHLLNEFHFRQQSEAQRQRLIAQSEFMRRISVAQDMATALAVTVDFFDEQIHPRRVVIASKGKEGYTIRAGTGLPPDMPVGATIGEGSVFGWVLRHCWPVLVDSNDQLPADIALPSSISPPLAVLPVAWGNTPRGAILLTGRKRFTRTERALMNFVTDVISATVSGFEDRRALEEHYVGTMTSLMATIEAKDSYTRGHTDRVTDLTVSLAEAVGVMGGELEDIRRAAVLHDIGKLAIPDEIITKPTKLDDEEYAEIKKHPGAGAGMLKHLKFLDSARMIIRSHHERYEGGGYPDGLTGEEIPIGARILAIADSYDAMTSSRAYRDAMVPAEALAEIQANAATQFDPRLALAFLEMMDKTRYVRPATRKSSAATVSQQCAR